MTVQEFYEAIGGSYQEALSRLMNDGMITRFVQKFPKDPSFGELKTSLEANDTETAFRQAHTLKGVCANLALGRLTKSASEITEMLRGGDLESAKAYFPNVDADYAYVMDCIGKLG